MEHALTNFENMTAEHLKEIAEAADMGCDYQVSTFTSSRSGEVCSIHSRIHGFYLYNGGSIRAVPAFGYQSPLLNPDAYIAKRNELGYKLEPKADNAYPHAGEVWYVGVDSNGCNASKAPLKPFGKWYYDPKPGMYGDIFNNFPPQLERLDLSALYTPADGQLKVTILGDGEYKVEKV